MGIDTTQVVCGGHAYICDYCERQIEGYERSAYWKHKDFSLCASCIKSLSIEIVFTDMKRDESVVCVRKNIPERVRNIVLSRDGHQCVFCGSTHSLQMDHIIPFSIGGSTEQENLQTLCKQCNRKKRNNV